MLLQDLGGARAVLLWASGTICNSFSCVICIFSEIIFFFKDPAKCTVTQAADLKECRGLGESSRHWVWPFLASGFPELALQPPPSQRPQGLGSCCGADKSHESCTTRAAGASPMPGFVFRKNHSDFTRVLCKRRAHYLPC